MWLLLVAVIAVVIGRGPRELAASNKGIARLDRRSGVVQVRSDGLVPWKEAVDRQTVFDGDRVATAGGARGRLAFGPGRSLDLGDSTQVQVTAIRRANKDNAFIITVIRGTVVGEIERSCLACPPLILRAGSDTFNVTPGKRLGVFRALTGKANAFDPKGPWPATATGSGVVVADAFFTGDSKAPAGPKKPPQRSAVAPRPLAAVVTLRPATAVAPPKPTTAVTVAPPPSALPVAPSPAARQAAAPQKLAVPQAPSLPSPSTPQALSPQPSVSPVSAAQVESPPPAK